MNKLTFIAINDIHWRGSNPASRTDEYMLALKAKLGEIAALASELDADGVLIAGDLVDVPGISLPVLTELDYALGKIPCEIYAIAGQHDEWDHSPASLARAPFGHQRRLEYIVDVAEEAQQMGLGKIDIEITGKHYDSTVESGDYYEPSENGLYCTTENVVKIHLAHGLVLERSPSFEMKHTLLENLKTSANILCVGDYHPGIGIKKLNNEAKTLVINPGALGRVKASHSDMDRQIQVAIIEVQEDGEYSARLHPLTSAKPGNEVLSREKLEAEAARGDKVAEYLELIQDTDGYKGVNIIEIMNIISNRKNLPQNVKDEALKRLGDAREKYLLALRLGVL